MKIVLRTGASLLTDKCNDDSPQTKSHVFILPKIIKVCLTFFDSVDIFHILVLQEYLVLTESRMLLKPVLGGVKMVALSVSSHEQNRYNRVCCFIKLRFSLFCRFLFSRLFACCIIFHVFCRLLIFFKIIFF